MNATGTCDGSAEGSPASSEIETCALTTNKLVRRAGACRLKLTQDFVSSWEAELDRRDEHTPQSSLEVDRRACFLTGFRKISQRIRRRVREKCAPPGQAQ